MKIRILASALLIFCVLGCTDFERTSFQTLSASKAVIDQAQADYEAKTLPHDACVFGIVNDAKAIQTVAVQALVVYEEEKAASKDLTAQTAVVASAIAELPAAIGEVKSLYSSPASLCGKIGGAK